MLEQTKAISLRGTCLRFQTGLQRNTDALKTLSDANTYPWTLIKTLQIRCFIIPNSSVPLHIGFLAGFKSKFLYRGFSNWMKKLTTCPDLKSKSHLLKKKMCGLLHWKPFKSNEECFLFHLKSSFRSQGI